MNKNRAFYFLIPLLSSILFTGLLFTGLYTKPDHKLYDLLLHVKPAVPEDESILLLNIDDLSISKVGMYPWSRNILADGLILLREFDAEYTVFDIEFTENSPMGVNQDLLQDEIPSTFDTEFAIIGESVQGLIQAITEGRVAGAEADYFVEDFMGFAEASKGRLLREVNLITRDNDEYFGQAAAFFGNTFYTVNMLPEIDPDVGEDAIGYAREQISLADFTLQEEWPHQAVGIRPAIYPIISKSKGAGFPTIVIDKDGLRRRINLLIEHEGKLFKQLAFAPLLDYLGNPSLTISRNEIILEEALFPNGSSEDVVIPLDEDGQFLINWPKKDFDDSFRSLSFYYLVLHSRQEKALIKNLKVMEEAGYLTYYPENPNIMEIYRQAEKRKEQVLQGGDRELIKEYIEYRKAFFEQIALFLESDAETVLTETLDSVLAMDNISSSQRDMYGEIREQVPRYYANSRSLYTNLIETRDILQEEIPGSFCLIGWIGTATTDRGVNPFDETYDNVGTHASVFNTILNRDFIDTASWWWPVLLSWIGGFGVYLINRKMNPLLSLVLGAGCVAFIFAAELLFFVLTRIYVSMFQPILTAGVTFIAMTVIKFLTTAKEKSYIRNAFGHYLSGDVINALIDNPDKLQLGGDKVYMTAMFTDVKGFSTISEKLDPTELVRLLNHYLTAMSDIILDLHGTIDKYEGDAIICFFGAPVPLEDHAERACEAAIRMKEVEKEFNEKYIQEGLAPSPLLTRIGINSGEMVVGNMGTERKMDYTIMGNSVNLAARLEGVNKQYGTWILMSGNTYDNGGSKFVYRRLDRVRVVGIHEPVRLYQVVGDRESTPEQMLHVVETFHTGLDLFEKKDWHGANELFNEVLEIIPDDGPAKKYQDRCREYVDNPPKESWDGVYNLTEK